MFVFILSIYLISFIVCLFVRLSVSLCVVYQGYKECLWHTSNLCWLLDDLDGCQVTPSGENFRQSSCSLVDKKGRACPEPAEVTAVLASRLVPHRAGVLFENSLSLGGCTRFIEGMVVAVRPIWKNHKVDLPLMRSTRSLKSCLRGPFTFPALISTFSPCPQWQEI